VAWLKTRENIYHERGEMAGSAEAKRESLFVKVTRDDVREEISAMRRLWRLAIEKRNRRNVSGGAKQSSSCLKMAKKLSNSSWRKRAAK
jgi:hypothetical protein